MMESMDLNDQSERWWRDAVCYQVYVRSFADGDGDGIGDLPGITSRLPYLADLGVDALWITPFYPSPQNDHGYDVADYCDVDPLFGQLADADRLIERAHELGLRVIVDLVPNHTSDQHRWFQEALAAGPGSPERARYIFRDGENDSPPNNWQSVFGGPAWTRTPDGQWYLHLFDSTQPDLDWRNPEVHAMFEDVLRFWLSRGVDGFRIDVAHGLYKVEGLPNQKDPSVRRIERMLDSAYGDDEPMWDQPEIHDVYRRWAEILDEFGPDRMAVAEAWVPDSESLAAYVRPDELDQAFNFSWLLADWSAPAFAEVIRRTFAATEPVGASPTWVLSNHDVTRHVTRYGGGEQGLARARAATLTMLALPGAVYLYQGEELGLEEVDVAPEHRQDPAWFRTREPGRDGCRVPVPWSGAEPPFGFGPGEGQPWIPQPEAWKTLTVEVQQDDPASTLTFYRAALEHRRQHATPAGQVVEILDQSEDVLAFRRGPLTVVLNCGAEPAELPSGEVLLSSSGPLADGLLPPDTAAWLG
jgi:alpha-glucosidase